MSVMASGRPPKSPASDLGRVATAVGNIIYVAGGDDVTPPDDGFLRLALSPAATLSDITTSDQRGQLYPSR